MLRRFPAQWPPVLAAGVIVLGCGGNVIVDGAPGGAGGDVTTGGFGGNATTGGFGGSVGGFGGSVTTTGTGGVTGLTCDDLLGGDPTNATWQSSLSPAAFEAELSYQAYATLDVCACEDLLSEGGCADLCAMAKNGTTTPNFCDGVHALTQCDQCLKVQCGMDVITCSLN